MGFGTCILTVTRTNLIYINGPKSSVSVQNNVSNDKSHENIKKEKDNKNDELDNNIPEDDSFDDMSDDDPNSIPPRIPPHPPLNISLFKNKEAWDEDERFSKNRKKHSDLSYGYGIEKVIIFSPEYIQYIK